MHVLFDLAPILDQRTELNVDMQQIILMPVTQCSLIMKKLSSDVAIDLNLRCPYGLSCFITQTAHWSDFLYNSVYLLTRFRNKCLVFWRSVVMLLKVTRADLFFGLFQTNTEAKEILLYLLYVASCTCLKKLRFHIPSGTFIPLLLQPRFWKESCCWF